MIDKSKSRGKIEAWGTVSRGNGFEAPELVGIAVVGIFCRKDIITSRVVDADDHFVQTRSGSVYVGEPHPDFLVALAEIGRLFDPERPIKVRS